MMWVLAAALAFSTARLLPVVLPDADIPRPEQVMAVPPELSARLQQHVIAPSTSRQTRLGLLMDFLFKESGLGMKYTADATLTVEEAYRRREGNCLTFTLLTVALARKAGLLVYAQQIDEIPVWHEEHNTVYRTNHVNAGINIGRLRFSVDVARDANTARLWPRRVSDERLLALYYNNRAAELMARGAPARAAASMAMSLQLDPGYANSWSNAGVLRRQAGHLDEAERDYLKALALDPMNTDALFNLVTLYDGKGEETRSAVFKERLEKARLKEPYFQFLLALGDEKQGDYARAVTHYKQAIHVYDGEPRFYRGLARAYQRLDDPRRAQHALDRATALDKRDVMDEPPAGPGVPRR